MKDRVRLARKIANVFPGCQPEWNEEDEAALAFRLVGANGAYRSNLVQIWRITEDIFTRTWLEWAVRNAKFPDEGMPRV